MAALASAFRITKPALSWASPGPLLGCSLGGGDYNSWPPTASIDYHYGKGLRTFRLPYSMEQAQRVPGGALATTYMASMDATIAYILGKGPDTKVITDPHQYGQYNFGNLFPSGEPHGDGGTTVVIGESANFTAAHLGDHLVRVASRYDPARVIIGTDNEPTAASDAIWPITVSTALAVLRAAGLPHYVTVMTNGMETGTAGPSGANAWGYSNAMTQMRRVTDPLDRVIFEIHQYLDSTGAGQSATCTVGSGIRLGLVTAWARKYGKKLYLGEFAGGANSGCDAEVTALLAYVYANRDVWVGAAWWYSVHGQPSYMYQLQPDDLGAPVDKPPMALLTPYL